MRTYPTNRHILNLPLNYPSLLYEYSSLHVHICVAYRAATFLHLYIHQASHMAYLVEMICLVFSAVGPPWSTRENYCLSFLTVLYMRHLHALYVCTCLYTVYRLRDLCLCLEALSRRLQNSSLRYYVSSTRS